MHIARVLLLSALALAAYHLSAQEAPTPPASPDASLELRLTQLKEAADSGDLHATRQLYMRYCIAGHTEQARAWAGRYTTLLAQKAAQGDVAAMRSLGFRYLSGEDYTPQDTEQGATWLSRAAEAGDASAAYMLGDYFARQGSGPMSQQHFRRAFSLYTQRAADPADHEALYCLGYMKQNGIGTTRDTAAGIADLTRASEAGSPWATAQLFKTYWDGLGTPKDEAKAISYARLAADTHRDGTMAYVAATAYLYGQGVEQDEALGQRYLEQAAAANIPDAIYMLASRMEAAGRQQQALPYYRQAASMQQRDALTRLGALLLYGSDQVEQDTEAGLAMLHTAASRLDSPQAAWELARYYAAAGESAAADSWISTAAQRGIAPAMARRGMLHLIPGSGVEWNPTLTYQWWLRGKQAQDPTCTLYIRLFYYLFIPLLLILVFGLPVYLRLRLLRQQRSAHSSLPSA